MSDHLTQGLLTSMGEPFKDRPYLAEGWTYRDTPRVSKETMEEFIKTLGNDNLRWITFVEYPSGKCRGQVLISPAGMEIINAKAKEALK